AYRIPHAGLRMFEVDHPDTQAWKLDLLQRTRIAVPQALTFVPVDFQTQSLGPQLAANGFAADAPAFFSWLGVTMYLDDAAVRSTLAWIAAHAAGGSAVVFDYAIARSRLNLFERLVFAAMAKRVAAIGEPWVATFDPRELIPA